MMAMWPALPGFNIEAVDYIDDKYLVVARAITATATCPNCKEQSSAAHSWYERVPHDLPSCGIVLRLCLQVRRFFCHNRACPRQIFCQRLPQLIKKYARRTQRLAKSLTILALALGGKEGERVVSKIGMPASRDTLLRLIRKQSDAELPNPRVIGVDDWAFRKGHTYGTLLCDLEQGKIIDLLPDRQAATLAGWLKAHPTVEIVTRDRSRAYAEGTTVGAPQAIQVADRWHLANNLVGALEATLARYPSCLQGAPAQEKAANSKSEELSDSRNQSTAKADMLAAREAKRVMRQAQYEQIIALNKQGVRKVDIATTVGVSVPTIKRWLAHGTFPERKRRASQPTILDPYRAYVHQRWQEGCHNLAQIYREINVRGFAGFYSTVYALCRELEQMNGTSMPSTPLSQALKRPNRRYSPRQAAFLFIRRPEKLSQTQEADLEVMMTVNTQFDLWRELAQQFMTMLRKRDASAFDSWLSAVAEYGSGSMKRFASGLQADYAEVAAALTYEWSNGPTEGHINRLKLVKRQMFGRAKLDLLRKRVMNRN